MAKTHSPKPTTSSTSTGALAKSKSSNKSQLNAEWVARKKEMEQNVVDAVNTKLAQLNRPAVIMKLPRRSLKGIKRPDYLPPPEERANMSRSDMKAWKAKQRRKRKALKQRENREKKKRMFEDIQSMLTTLPSVEVKVPGKDEDMESDKASGAGAGKIQMVKEADQMDMVLGITSCDVICSGGFLAPSMNHDISDKKGLPEDGKVKVPGMSLEPVKSSEVVYAPQGFVANGAILSGNDLSNTVDDARVIDVIKDTHDLEALVLSEEYEFNLFDELIGNLEEVKIHVVENEFDRRFNPVDTNEEDDMETDISVIDNSFLDYQLPL